MPVTFSYFSAETIQQSSFQYRNAENAVFMDRLFIYLFIIKHIFMYFTNVNPVTVVTYQ
jgi:hypothetical protein